MCFLQSLVQNTIAKRELAAYIDESQVAIDGVSSNDDAFDELVRIAFDDHTILARSGLALVGIATEVNRLAGVFRDEAPLQTGRKSRAAPAA